MGWDITENSLNSFNLILKKEKKQFNKKNGKLNKQKKQKITEGNRNEVVILMFTLRTLNIQIKVKVYNSIKDKFYKAVLLIKWSNN